MKFKELDRGFHLMVGLFVLMSLILVAWGDTTAAPAATTQPATGGTTAAGSTAASGANSGPATDLNLGILPLALEAGLPPDNWEGYQIIKNKLNIILKLSFLPVGADGDTKLNTAAASNSLPVIFQMSSTNNQLFTSGLTRASQGEGYYLLGFGKEGVNYKKDAQGNISLDGVPTPITRPRPCRSCNSAI